MKDDNFQLIEAFYHPDSREKYAQLLQYITEKNHAAIAQICWDKVHVLEAELGRKLDFDLREFLKYVIIPHHKQQSKRVKVILNHLEAEKQGVTPDATEILS